MDEQCSRYVPEYLKQAPLQEICTGLKAAIINLIYRFRGMEPQGPEAG